MAVQFLVPAIVGALAAGMTSLVGRVVLSLGIGFVTYKGIDTALTSLRQSVIDGFRGMPSDVLNLMGYLWLDKGITIIFSAVVVAVSMRLIGGGLKKMVFK